MIVKFSSLEFVIVQLIKKSIDDPQIIIYTISAPKLGTIIEIINKIFF